MRADLSDTRWPELVVGSPGNTSPSEHPLSEPQPLPPVAGFAGLFAMFDPISLEDTNKSSQMLTRFDNKYILKLRDLEIFLEALKSSYLVLEIDGSRIFQYRSCYFDDNYRCYYEHHNGKRLRFKVRTRHYVNNGSVYFEVKLKDHRGRTKKERIKGQTFFTERIDGEYLSMLSEFYHRSYRRPFEYTLRPSLIVSNNRVTLVARQGGERMTIDFGVGFTGIDGRSVRVGNDFIIVETKSSNGKGVADQLLRNIGIRKARKCSKYCIGANLVGHTERRNNFRPILGLVEQNIGQVEPENLPHDLANKNLAPWDREHGK